MIKTFKSFTILAKIVKDLKVFIIKNTKQSQQDSQNCERFKSLYHQEHQTISTG
jgi:hypothetical protein